VTVHDLPIVNASLNGLSAVFIAVGWFFIKTGKIKQHMICMISAVATSTLFLACYLTYHFSVRVITRFTAPGWIHTFYITMLTSHVLLAFATVPLVLMTLTPALKQRFDKHKRIARWTLPIWLYVSVTGVLVYMMLYQWFPPWKYPPLLHA
jgi:putative membrane protein